MIIIKNIENLLSSDNIGVLHNIKNIDHYKRESFINNFIQKFEKNGVKVECLNADFMIYEIKIPNINKEIIVTLKKRYFMLQVEKDIFLINRKNKIFAYENLDLDKNLSYISFKVDKKNFLPKSVSSLTFLFPEYEYRKITIQKENDNINIIKSRKTPQKDINTILTYINKSNLLETGTIKKEEYEILSLQFDDLNIVKALYNEKNNYKKVKNEIRN